MDPEIRNAFMNPRQIHSQEFQIANITNKVEDSSPDNDIKSTSEVSHSPINAETSQSSPLMSEPPIKKARRSRPSKTKNDSFYIID